MAQGQNAGTARKERGFRATFSISLNLSKSDAVRKYPYWHIDLHSGSGFNAIAGCDGSPIVFLQEGIRFGRRFNARFCDIDHEAINQLRERMQEYALPHGSTARAFARSNVDFLGCVANEIKGTGEKSEHAMGSLLFDPNGWKDPEDMLFPALQRFAREFPKIDLIMNVNVGLFGMVRKSHHQSEKFARRPMIPEIIAALNRPHWMIREPGNNPGMKFVTFVGRTFDLGNRPFEEFYDIKTREGQWIAVEMKRLPNQQTLIQFPKGDR